MTVVFFSDAAAEPKFVSDFFAFQPAARSFSYSTVYRRPLSVTDIRCRYNKCRPDDNETICLPPFSTTSGGRAATPVDSISNITFSVSVL